MKNNVKITVLIVCLLVGLMFCMQADAAKSKAKPKPKPKVKAKVAPHIVKGTTQLSGEDGQFGTTYMLGNNDSNMNFNITSAEYSVEPTKYGDTWIIPKQGEKLLLLHLTMHNPNKIETFARWDTLKFTVVDSKSTNWEYSQNVAVAKTRESFGMTMKPAQKIELYTTITVPDKEEMPKLMVAYFDTPKVVRYDLRGKVKGLPSQYADPADKSGASVYDKVPAKGGEYYVNGPSYIKIDGIEFTNDAVNGEQPEDDYKFMLIKATVKSAIDTYNNLRFDTFAAKLVDADGNEVQSSDVLQNSKLKSADLELSAFQEYKFRFFFKVEKDFEAKYLSVNYYDGGRKLNFDLGSIK